MEPYCHFFENSKLQMQISVVSPFGSTLIKLDDKSNASTLYFALFGRSFDHNKFNVISSGRILNPFLALADQGISENSLVQFLPTSFPPQNNTETLNSSDISDTNTQNENKPKNYLPPLVPHDLHTMVEPAPQQDDLKMQISNFDNLGEYSFIEYDEEEEEEEEEDEFDTERFNYTQKCIKSIENENARIYEIQLSKLESHPKCGVLLQQMEKSMQQFVSQYYQRYQQTVKNPDDNKYEKPQAVTKDALPCFWEKDSEHYSKNYRYFDQYQFSSIEEAGKAIRKGDAWDW